MLHQFYGRVSGEGLVVRRVVVEVVGGSFLGDVQVLVVLAAVPFREHLTKVLEGLLLVDLFKSI